MKYTVNEYLDLIGSGKPKRKSKVSRKPTKEHKEHVQAVMELYGLGKKQADDLCYECEHMVKVKGGSFWSWLKNAAADVGKAVVGMVPGVGAYGVEGIDALQHNRKYDPVKATKNAAINLGTSFLPPGLKQAANFGLKKATGGKPKKATGGKPKKTSGGKKRKVSEKMKERGQMIKKIMKKTGMSLGGASAFLKKNGY